MAEGSCQINEEVRRSTRINRKDNDRAVRKQLFEKLDTIQPESLRNIDEDEENVEIRRFTGDCRSLPLRKNDLIRGKNSHATDGLDSLQGPEYGDYGICEINGFVDNRDVDELSEYSDTEITEDYVNPNEEEYESESDSEITLLDSSIFTNQDSQEKVAQNDVPESHSSNQEEDNSLDSGVNFERSVLSTRNLIESDDEEEVTDCEIQHSPDVKLHEQTVQNVEIGQDLHHENSGVQSSSEEPMDNCEDQQSTPRSVASTNIMVKQKPPEEPIENVTPSKALANGVGAMELEMRAQDVKPCMISLDPYPTDKVLCRKRKSDGKTVLCSADRRAALYWIDEFPEHEILMAFNGEPSTEHMQHQIKHRYILGVQASFIGILEEFKYSCHPQPRVTMKVRRVYPDDGTMIVIQFFNIDPNMYSIGRMLIIKGICHHNYIQGIEIESVGVYPLESSEAVNFTTVPTVVVKCEPNP